MINKIKQFYTIGNPRSTKLKKNISASFIIKGISIIIGLIKVPVILSYLDPEKYGVWLTIASIIMWIHHFDLGLGHGLRNKFAESLALNDVERGKKLVSTAYISMSLIMVSVLMLMAPLVFWLDWSKVLNVKTIPETELVLSVLVVLVMFIARFIFQLITVILKADQRPAISDIYLPVASLVSLLLISVAKAFSDDSLLLASVIISVPPVLLLFLGNIYFFSRDYKQYKPTLGGFDKSHLVDIYSLGLKFFFGQLLMLVMFSSQNFIITQVINPQEVTIYNIAKQYFGMPLTFFMIIITPYWSAITDAYVKGEIKWIKDNMKKLNLVSIIFAVGIIGMLFISEFAYKIWLGGRVSIPFSLSASFALLNVFVVFLSPYNYFLNGTGKLTLGLYVGGVKMLLFLPVAIFFIKLFGSIGLVFSMLLINSLPNFFINIIHYNKLINQKATGIWNK